MGYRPAVEEGREAAEWLATGEGHAWQDQQNQGRGTYGLTGMPWIALKDDDSEDTWSATWSPGLVTHTYRQFDTE